MKEEERGLRERERENGRDERRRRRSFPVARCALFFSRDALVDSQQRRRPSPMGVGQHGDISVAERERKEFHPLSLYRSRVRKTLKETTEIFLVGPLCAQQTKNKTNPNIFPSPPITLLLPKPRRRPPPSPQLGRGAPGAARRAPGCRRRAPPPSFRSCPRDRRR
jgi:hypothetical protein